MNKLRTAAVGLAAASLPMGAAAGYYMASTVGEGINESRADARECIDYFDAAGEGCDTSFIEKLLGDAAINDVEVTPETVLVSYSPEEIVQEAQEFLKQNPEKKEGESLALGVTIGFAVSALSGYGSWKLWRYARKPVVHSSVGSEV